jgi:hypothetical protein
MNPIEINGSNRVFTKPKDMTDEECGPLYVRVERYENYHTTIKSAWQPTDEERIKIALGEPIILTIIGISHPPVALSVGE